MEQTLDELVSKLPESSKKAEIAPVVRATAEYKGIELLEEKKYAGGTSIKYWM